MEILSLYNNNFLNENRAHLNALAGVQALPKQEEETLELEKGTKFKAYINREMEKLNNQQIKADKLTEDFIKGEVEDIHTVMIATEEARLSLELAVQVRNRLIEAYKEITNMQL